MNEQSGYVTLEGEELRKATLKAAGWTDFGQHHTPRVESSVDAALEYLTLPDGLRWEITGPCSHFGYDVFIQDSAGFPITSASGSSAAVAMCQAYLAYKAGA